MQEVPLAFDPDFSHRLHRPGAPGQSAMLAKKARHFSSPIERSS
jgi:hypothetical protein